MTRSRMAHVALFAFFTAISVNSFGAQADSQKHALGEAIPGDARTAGSSTVGTGESAKNLSNGLVLSGNLSYSYVGSSVTLTAQGIVNNSSTRTSGTLRLELWASVTQPARAGAITGYRLAASQQIAQLQPQFQYTNHVETTSFLPPPNGTYWMVFVLGEFDPANCSSNQSYCVADSLVIDQRTFGPATPAITPGATTKSLGSRATVSSGATLFGGFEVSTDSLIYILVRGNSLGTLGVTQAYLDAPRVRLFNAAGGDLVTQGGVPGFNDCLASNTVTDLPVVNYYSQVRAAPVQDRDSCYAVSLPGGAYTFTVTPSIPGVTSSGTSSSPSQGQVLFEVTIGH
jgi:hypothetical protein